jgi:uncharacterized protein (UPF0548 family)
VRLTTATRLRETPVDCQRWADSPATASVEDLENAKLDTYSSFVRGTGYETATETFERAIDLLLQYRLFPPETVDATVCTPDARIGPGTVIVQRGYFGPFAVESAVRVEQISDEPTFAGRRFAFTVVTLEGHPLRGVETVALLLHETGRIELNFTSTSRPAGLLSTLGAPLTRRLQRRANQAAMAHFRGLVAEPVELPPTPLAAGRAIRLIESGDTATARPAAPAPLPPGAAEVPSETAPASSGSGSGDSGDENRANLLM